MRLLLLLLVPYFLSGQVPQLVLPNNHTGPIHGLAISSDARHLATSAGNDVKIWEYRTGRLIKSFTFSGASAFTSYKENLAFSKDGNYLIALSDEALHLIDARSYEVVDSQNLYASEITILGRKSHTGAVAVHPDGDRFHFERRIDGRYTLEEYHLADRRLSTVASFTVDDNSNKPARRITYDPLGKLVLVTFTATVDNKIINLAKKEAFDYKYGESYLPNGNLLVQFRQAGATTLRAVTPAGETIWEKKITSPDLQPWKDEYTNLAIDEDTERFYYGIEDGGMISGNFATGAGVSYGSKPGNAKGGALLLAPGGGLLVTTTAPSSVVVADSVTNQVKRKIAAHSLSLSFFTTDPASLRFAVSGREHSVRVYGMTVRGPRLLYATQSLGFVDLGLSRGGRYLVTLDAKNEHVEIHDIERGTKRKLEMPFAKPLRAAVAEDGAVAAVSASGTAYFPAGETRSAWVKPFTVDPNYASDLYHAVALSPDGETVLAGGRTPGGLNGNATAATLLAFRASNGKEIWRRESSLGAYRFSADGETILGGDYRTGVRLNARNGKELNKFRTGEGNVLYAGVDDDAERISAYRESERGEVIDVFDAASGQVIQSLAGHTNTIIRDGFLSNGFHLSAGYDNTIRLWDEQTGEEVAKLFFFDDLREWVVLSSDGRFDATDGAMKLLHYRVGSRLVPLEQLFENFLTPGLLGQKLLRASAPAVEPIRVSEVVEPPSVTLTYVAGSRNLIVEDDDASVQSIRALSRDARLVVEGTGRGSAISELRLYHNGKLISGTTRNLVVEDDVPAGNSRTYSVRLVEGDNEFRAVAINAQRTESAPAQLRLTYVAPAAAPKRDGVTLHLITVGINQYKNAKYNLNYAEADAAGVESQITTGLSQVVADTRRHTIRNNGATRRQILAALQTIKDEAQPEDLLVFYYAGHGIMSEGAERDFYLVPHDVTQIYGNDGGLAEKGISATELKSIASSIPARKQLYILDACNSAGAVESIVTRGAAEERAIAQLARSTGTHWLTASGSTQEASEFDELGHGAFTYVVLEALRGKAAGDDERVTVNELKAYLDRVVPEITEDKTGIAQYPASFGYGQDFPLSVGQR